MTAAVLTPLYGSEAVELGNRQWIKKILPVGEVEYKGRMLHFTKDYLGQLVAAFQTRAYDQVPFQLADAMNTHTNDPERTRGEITGMELRGDGLYVTAEVTPEGEQVLTSNPLGVSARIVEDYARSDGKRFPAAIQHVLGTLDPRIPGLGAWEAIEASNPVADTVIDLSASQFTGTEASAAGDKADAMSRGIAGKPSGGGPKAHRKAAKAHQKAAQLSNVPSAVAHHQKLAGLHTAVAEGQMTSIDASKQMNLAAEHGGGDMPARDEGTGMDLTDEQKASITELLGLDEAQLDALTEGGVVLTPDELLALTSETPGDADDSADEGEDDEDGLAAEVAGMSDEDFAVMQAAFEAEQQEEPVAAGLSAEAQFAIDLATARAEETQREMSVISARLREQDYLAEKRRLADLGVPPFITELARPLLEGSGRTVDLANGKTADAGQIVRKVLTEYAQQAKLLDLDVELGSPMDEPEDAGREQLDKGREDVVSRFKQMTGLK